MRMIRLFGTAVAVAGIIASGVTVASAEVPAAAPVVESAPSTGSASGSGNLVAGLGNLLSTGSGDVKPLPKAKRSEIATGYDNPWLDGWGNGSGNLVIGLYRLFGSGSAAK